LILMSAGIAKDVPRIVVGVDGSPGSRAALRWAVGQAALGGGVVDAVMAWQISAELQSFARTPVYAEEPGWAATFAADAKKTLEAVVSDEVEPADSQRVTSRVVNGHPAEVLLEASAGAVLLVVGHRGHGAFADALLGSVGQYCVQHAPCPVLVMRGDAGT
jgi:nucleotide-binding universal stress UspA family protein